MAKTQIGTELRGVINNLFSGIEKCSDDILGYVERLGCRVIYERA